MLKLAKTWLSPWEHGYSQVVPQNRVFSRPQSAVWDAAVTPIDGSSLLPLSTHGGHRTCPAETFQDQAHHPCASHPAWRSRSRNSALPRDEASPHCSQLNLKGENLHQSSICFPTGREGVFSGWGPTWLQAKRCDLGFPFGLRQKFLTPGLKRRGSPLTTHSHLQTTVPLQTFKGVSCSCHFPTSSPSYSTMLPKLCSTDCDPTKCSTE